MELWVVYHSSGKVIGVFDTADAADYARLVHVGAGGFVERHELNSLSLCG